MVLVAVGAVPGKVVGEFSDTQTCGERSVQISVQIMLLHELLGEVKPPAFRPFPQR